MTDYNFYRRTDTETKIVATLQQDKFSGVEAEMIKSLLKRNGYPAKTPDRILHGSRLWAVAK